MRLLHQDIFLICLVLALSIPEAYMIVQADCVQDKEQVTEPDVDTCYSVPYAHAHNLQLLCVTPC